MPTKQTSSCFKLGFWMLALLFVSLGRPLLATEVYWDGGGADENWSNADNWSANVLPLSTHSVVFDGLISNKSCTIDMNVNVSSLALTNSYGGLVTMGGGFDVTLLNDFKLLAGGFAAAGFLDVGKDWEVYSSTAFIPGTSTVTLNAPGTSFITGSTTFYRLRSMTANTTRYFQAGSTTTVLNHLRFENVGLLSSVNNIQWHLKFLGSNQLVSNVRVKDSDASSGATIVTSSPSVDLGNNVNWAIGPIDTPNRYWIAVGGQNWNNPNFWSYTSGGAGGASVPMSTHSVIFNGASGANGNCNISTPVVVSSFVISGYSGMIDTFGNSFTVTSYYYQTSGTMDLDTSTAVFGGDLIKTGGSFMAQMSTITLNGAGNQTLTMQGNLFNGLIIDKPSGAVNSTVGFETRSMFRILNGIFNPGSWEYFPNGGWEQSGGTFNHIGSTMTFGTYWGTSVDILAAKNGFDCIKVNTIPQVSLNISTSIIAQRIDIANGHVMFLNNSGRSTISHGITMSGGEFNLARATVAINQGMPFTMYGGTFTMTTPGTLEVSSLTVSGSARVEWLNPSFDGAPTITRPGSGTVSVTLDSKIDISTAVFDFLDSSGLIIGPNANIIKLSSVTFTNTFAGGRSILWQKNSAGPWTLDGMVFTSTNTNIDVPGSGPAITMRSSQGTGAGSAFEVDPNNRVSWVPDPNILELPTRYWIAVGGQNWNNPNAWSQTSGGPGGASVPVATHTVIFDGVSSANGTCNINVPVSVSTIIINGYTGFFNTQNNPLIISKLFEQHSGNVNLTQSTVTIQGDFIRSNGSFDADSSTIIFAGSAAQSISPNGAFFSNVLINKTSGIVTALSAVNTSGYFMIQSGTFNAGSFIHSFRGDLIDQNGGFRGISSTATFNGTGNQFINLLAGSHFNNLVVNKASGILTLGSSLTINGNLQFINGQTNWGSFYHSVGRNFVDDAGNHGFQPDGGIIFNGTTTQRIRGAVGAVLFPNIVIDSNAPVIAEKRLIIMESGSGLGGDFTMLNGTFVAGTFSHDVQGNWNQVGGNFTSAGSTIVFASQIAESTQSIVSTIHAFDSFRIDTASSAEVHVLAPVTAQHMTMANGLVEFMPSSVRSTMHTGITMMGGTMIVTRSTVATDAGAGLQLSGGVFEMEDRGRLEVSNLTAITTSTVYIVDAFQNGPSVVTAPSGSISVLLDSNVDISSVIFSGMDSNGVTIGASATISTFSAITFMNQQAASAAVRWQKNDAQTYNLYGLRFDGTGTDKNINATGLANPIINVHNSTGLKAGSLHEIDPNNRVFWLPDPNPISTTTTFLSPFVTNLASTSFRVQWTPIGGNYRAILSTSSSFFPTVSSTSYTGNIATFTGLSPLTQYFFGVKLSTDSDIGYLLNQISTITVAPSTTLLNPVFSFVGTHDITVNWTSVSGMNYDTHLATSPTFTQLLFSHANDPYSSRNYPGLVPDATYFFRVKVSTEPNFNATISTKTLSLVGGGNSALQFNGSNQFVRVADDSQFRMLSGNSSTVETWFRRTTTNSPSQDEYLISKDNPARTNGWALTITPSRRIRFEVLGNAGIMSGRVIDDTLWHHVAVTKSPSGDFNLYIDGNAEGYNYISGMGTNTDPVKFGNSEMNDRGFNGVLDEIRYTTYARTQSEIQNNMSTAPAPGIYFGYWDLNQNGGQTALNKGWGSGIHGALGPDGSTTQDPAWVFDPIPGFGTGPDVTPPTVKIITPSSSTANPISSLNTVFGTASDDKGVNSVMVTLKRQSDGYYWSNGGYWSPTFYSIPATGTTTWNLSGPVISWSTGTYEISAAAQDSTFNIGVASFTFSVVTSTDSSAPSISIFYPVSNSTYTGSQLTTLSGFASDNEGTPQVRVRFVRFSDSMEWNGNMVLWQTPGGTHHFNDIYMPPATTLWSYYPPISAWTQSGTYMMVAQAKDVANLQASTTIFFHVSNSTDSTSDIISPTVSIVHPASGTVHAPAALAVLSGYANDNVSLMELSVSVRKMPGGLYWNGSTFASVTEMFWYRWPPHNWTFGDIPTAQWSDGHYILHARARDTNNNYGDAFSEFDVNASSAGDTLPPTLSISNPVSGSAYTPTTLYISGYAFDNISVASVTLSLRNVDTGFYYDGVGFFSGAQIYRPVNYPFSAWTYHVPPAAFTNGSYAINVLAQDSAGLIQTSSVTFTISGASASGDVTPPVVVISTPVNNISYSSTTMPNLLRGTASDNVAVTEVLISLKDDSNLYFTGANWTHATEFWLATSSAPTAWKFVMPLASWKNGSYVMRALARDSNNNVTYSSATFNIVNLSSGTGNGDTQPPQTYIYNPVNGTSQSPHSFTRLNGRSEDSFGISEVLISLRSNAATMYWNGAGFTSPTEWFMGAAISTSNAYGVDWELFLPYSAYTNGSYVMRVKAKDTNNNIRIVSSTFTVFGASVGAGDTLPPLVGLTTPADGGSYTSSQLLTITGTAADDTALQIVEVRILRGADSWDGAVFRPGDFWLFANGLSTWTFNSPAALWSAGSYSFSVRAKDTVGNIGTITRNLTITGTGSVGTPPTVTLSYPVALSTYTSSQLTSFNGTATDDVSVTNVQVRITDMNLQQDWDPVTLTWTPTDRWNNANHSAGTWNYTQMPFWPSGVFRVMVRAIDNSGLYSVPQTAQFNVNYGGGGASDFNPPSTIADLTATQGPEIGSVYLSWTAPGDDGTTGTASSYIIKYRTSAPILTQADRDASFDVALPPVYQIPPAPLVAGTPQSMTVRNLTPGVAYFWSIRAQDENFNRGGISNSPLATAFGGCVAGVGDGEGTATLSASTLQETTLTPLAIIFTVGATGITQGGSVRFKIPDNWAYPQTWGPTYSGYVSYTVSNPLANMSMMQNGSIVTLNLNSGTLNAGDQVTLHYTASPSCGIQANIPIKVLSQATSCGQPKEITTNPTVSVTAGPASWLGFASYEKIVQIGQATALVVRGQNSCGALAAVNANTHMNLAAEVYNPNTGFWSTDGNAELSLLSNMSVSTNAVTLASGQSSTTFYYRLNASPTNQTRVRIRYVDLYSGTYMSENFVQIQGTTQAQVISSATVDTGVIGSSQTVIITPNGDGLNDIAFINFNTGNLQLSWHIELSKDNFSTIAQEYWGYGSFVRQAWDGRRSYPFYDTAPTGTYNVRITAGGAENTNLNIVLQGTGLSAHVKNNSNNANVAQARVNIFGPITKYTETDANGDFTFTGLPAGNYTLSVEKDGFSRHQAQINFVGGTQTLADIALKPAAQLVFKGSRTDTINEIWGSIVARGGGQEIRTAVRFAQGRSSADIGYSTANPTLMLEPGVSYDIRAEIPGLTATPLAGQIFAEGQIFDWVVSFGAKAGISGFVQLANGLSNLTGVYVNLAAGLDNDSNGTYDLGYPSFFANTYIPAGEPQAAYTLPGLGNGTFRVDARADGFTPQTKTIVLNITDATTNFIFAKTGQVTVNCQFTGDTTTLDTVAGDPADGYFPVTLRLTSTAGFNLTKKVYFQTSGTSFSTSTILEGVPNGAYLLYIERLPGFEKNPPGVATVAVAAGVGTVSINMVKNSGAISGLVTLPISSAFSNLLFRLSKDTLVLTNPANPSFNRYLFADLESGQYTLSVVDPISNASAIQSLFVVNGATTTFNIDLSSSVFYSVRGTVRTGASPPYNSLASIVANSTPTVIYTATGTHSVSVLRVEALRLNPNGTVDTLPTAPGSIWDQAKVRFGNVETTSGTYEITGLRAGVSYRVRLNTDLDNDGIANIPLDQRTVTLTADLNNVDFTIRDGGKIQGTITAPASDNGHSLTIMLTDTELKKEVARVQVALVGSEASFLFENLRVGRYLVETLDNDSPATYAAKPVFIALDNTAETKTLAITLTRGAVIRGKLADRYGVIITSANAAYLLPSDFKIRCVSAGHLVDATGPSADGTFTINILPNVDYTVEIKPPQDRGNRRDGKSFLPSAFKAKASAGQFYDWGTLVLQAGTNVPGTVVSDANVPIANVPVYAYQSLARNLDPIKLITDEQGVFVFEDLDPRVRFYDLVANRGGADSLSQWSSSERTMIDITKSAQIQNITLVLAPLSGGLQGTVLPVVGNELIAAYGEKQGFAGASILLTKRGERKIQEFITAADGTFNILVPSGNYDMEILAMGHEPYRLTNVSIKNQLVNLGSLQLEGGVSLTGDLRNADGSLPTQEQVAKLLAINANKFIARAHLIQESVTGSIDRYAFYGLAAGTYSIVAVDQLGRPKELKAGLFVSNQDLVLNLTFAVVEPQLVASFIQKLPDGVEAIFGCNQAFRNNEDDLDGNGTADDSEFENFVSILSGDGTIEFASISSDRQKASYLYTEGIVESGNVLELFAQFRTEQINPQTGSNFVVSSTFTHPFGLQAQQEDVVTNLGGEFILPGGSGFALPENWSDVGLDGALVRFQAADTVDDAVSSQQHYSGAGAMRLAKKLGAKAYPAHMYRAINAIQSAPDVQDKLFSSFYDIFLPQSVARIFTNRATLTLRYDDSVTDPAALNIYYFNESNGVYTIENNDRRIDTVNKTISVSIGHASVFTVLSSSQPIIRGDAHAGVISAFNFPNPFDLNSKTVTLQNPGSNNPSQTIEGTMIKVSLPANVSGDIKIEIFTIAAQKVREIHRTAPTDESHYYIEWDGRNDHGEQVASGIYVARITVAGGNEMFIKMAVVK